MSSQTAQAPAHPLPGPGLTLLLRPDLVILDASDDYCRATLVRASDLAGERMFDAFPDNPAEPRADGVGNLRRSLGRVVAHGGADQMPMQRYDVRDRIADGGEWVEKFWLPTNYAVFGSGSSEITHVVHEVRDVTAAVLALRWLAEREQVLDERLQSLKALHTDTEREVVRVRASHDELSAIVNGGATPAQLEAQLAVAGAPDERLYFAPGDRAPRYAVYRSLHHPGCQTAPTYVLLREGWGFRDCNVCGVRVFYRLERELS